MRSDRCINEQEVEKLARRIVEEIIPDYVKEAVAKERERVARILDHYGSVRVTAEMIAKKIRSGEAAE